MLSCEIVKNKQKKIWKKKIISIIIDQIVDSEAQLVDLFHLFVSIWVGCGFTGCLRPPPIPVLQIRNEWMNEWDR